MELKILFFKRLSQPSAGEINAPSPSIFVLHKKYFRNIYAPLGAKSKITTYMYKALFIQNVEQGRTKHNQIRVKDYILMIKWQKS